MEKLISSTKYTFNEFNIIQDLFPHLIKDYDNLHPKELVNEYQELLIKKKLISFLLRNKKFENLDKNDTFDYRLKKRKKNHV